MANCHIYVERYQRITLMMKPSVSNRVNTLSAKRCYRTAPAVFLILFLLTACQKESEPETTNQTAADTPTQTAPVTTNINGAEDNSTDGTQNESALNNSTQDGAQNEASSERDMSLTSLDKDLNETVPASRDVAVAPNPEQAIKGAQITDVRYKSAAGENLSVVFETSAAGMLNAIITRPNQPKLTLSAPEGQGNNPTYQSADGSIQLVSHAGGGTIDLIRNNKITSYDAVSAEAEVITE